MNIVERYKWPVIVAASLHGALLIGFNDPERIGRSAPPDGHITTCEFPLVTDDPIPLPPDDVDAQSSTETAPGSPTPLPQAPDLPPLTRDPHFTVPVQENAKVIDPIKTLKDYQGGPIGPSDNRLLGGPPRGDIMPLTKLDRPPRAVAQPAPTYPPEANRNGLTGTVTVEFVVNTDGTVTQAEAVKWSHREFVEPAVRAVSRWRFEPGTVSGRKVRFRMAVPIEFNAS